MSQIDEAFTDENMYDSNPDTDFSFESSFSQHFIKNLILPAIDSLDAVLKVAKNDEDIMESLESNETLSAESIENRALIRDQAAKIVRGLATLKIGDPSFIKKKCSCEKNLKETVDMFNCVTNKPSDATETVFIDGHGDAKIQKKPVEKSTSFFQKIIMELDGEISQTEIRKPPKIVIDPVVQEKMSVWEEQKEKLIRVIDGNAEEENESFEEGIFVGIEPKITTPATENVEEIVTEEVESFLHLPETADQKSLPPPPTKLTHPPIPGDCSELESKDNCKVRKPRKPNNWLGNKFRKLFDFFFRANKH